jgi:hypothetical protein
MRRNKIIIFLFLVFLATLARSLFLLNSDNFDGSFSMGRVTAALCILENPGLRLNFDGNSSILYHYLLATALYFWRNPLITPRIFTMLFGILLIVPFYLLIEMLFNQEIAFYSSILLSFYPLHVMQSTLSTSDVVFHFFFFACLYYFFKFKLKEKKVFWLILSAILFNIAAMLRFESWVFIPLLSIFLYKDGKRYSAAFFLLSLILPSIWLYLCYHYTGNVFYSFTKSASTAHTEILLRTVPYSKKVLGWLNVLAKTITAPIVICGVCGIFYAFIRKKFWHLALFFLYLYFLYTVNTLLERMWLNERYGILLGLLILPYSILCVERISLFLRLKPIILFLPFVLFSLLQFQKITVSRMPILPEGVKEVAHWLKFHASLKDRIILGSDAWNTTDQDIVARSGLSLRNFLVVTTPLVPGAEINLDKHIEGYIVDKRPRYLILNSTGFLNKILGFDMNQETQHKFGCNFNLLFSKSLEGYEIFNIYEISYDDL